MLSDLVKIQPKHANSRSKFLSQEIKYMIKLSAIFAEIFLRVFSLSFQQSEWLIYEAPMSNLNHWSK